MEAFLPCYGITIRASDDALDVNGDQPETLLRKAAEFFRFMLVNRIDELGAIVAGERWDEFQDLFECYLEEEPEDDEPVVSGALEIGVEMPPMEAKVGRLLKRATKAKKAGKIGEAIGLCEEALGLAETTGISDHWAMGPHMKLAAYLTEDGKADDAWSYCEIWLAQGRTDFDKMRIYDRMRIILQKQDCNVDAVAYGFCSLLWHFDALRGQEDLQTSYMSQNALTYNVRSLLTKAGKEHLVAEGVALIRRLHDQGEPVEPDTVKKELNAIEGFSSE